MKIHVKYSLCLLLCAITSNAVAGQKFESLEEFGQFTEGHIMVDMAWLDPVSFKGHLNYGAVTSQSSNPLYYDTGIGPAGPAIQLIAQAIGTKRARKKKHAEAQAIADQVLTGYTNKIAGLSMEDLYFHFKKMAEQNQHSVEVFTPDKKNSDFFVKMHPVFMLSQDQRSIMLTNNVQIHARKRIKKPIFKQRFIVVSDPIEVDDISGFWLQHNENNLLDLSKHLFTLSISLMLDEISQKRNASAKQRTFKYKFGGKTMFERASLATTRASSDQCGRADVITLGGDLMSLPLPELTCSAQQLIE